MKYATSITKERILKPEGQAFGIGDLVRLLHGDAVMNIPAGTLCRILGSYAQLHSAFLGGAEPSFRDLNQFSLVEVETGRSWSWTDYDALELVPEAGSIL